MDVNIPLKSVSFTEYSADLFKHPLRSILKERKRDISDKEYVLGGREVVMPYRFKILLVRLRRVINSTSFVILQKKFEDRFPDGIFRGVYLLN